LGYLAKLTLASLLACFCSLACGAWLGDGTLTVCAGKSFAFTRNFIEQTLQFGGMGAVYLASFLVCARMLRLHEIFSFFKSRA
jgi:hypothetical protein